MAVCIVIIHVAGMFQAQDTQRQLAATVENNAGESDALEACVEELEARLKSETDAREYLAVECNKAEGEQYTETMDKA